MNNSSEHVSWVLEVTVREGRDANLRNLMAEMCTATQRDEPETLDYEWFLSDDGRRLHLYERYANSAAAELHATAFNAHYAGRFFDILQFERIVLYGAPSQAIRDAFAPFGCKVLAQANGFSRRAKASAPSARVPDDVRQAHQTA